MSAATKAAWARSHPDKLREARRKWREARERLASLQRYYNNRDVYLARGKEWARKNPEKARERGRRHDAKPERKKPRGDYKARTARYQTKHLKRLRARRRAYQAKRRQNPAQRVVDAIRRRMRHVIKGKTKGAFALLGYTADDLRSHLEAQFQTGMSWDNYGLWHVDHRRLVSSFKLPDELVQCFALSNLRPLWAPENLARKRKYDALGYPIA